MLHVNSCDCAGTSAAPFRLGCVALATPWAEKGEGCALAWNGHCNWYEDTRDTNREPEKMGTEDDFWDNWG